MKNVMAIGFFALILCSCSNSNTSHESGNSSNIETSQEETVLDILKRDIMDSHDITMAKMNTMAKLRGELKDTWKTQKDTAEYYNAYMDLGQAKTDMMDWMHAFKDMTEMEATDAEKEAYLREQFAKMKNLEEYTMSSIKVAKKLLGKG